MQVECVFKYHLNHVTETYTPANSGVKIITQLRNYRYMQLYFQENCV